MKTYKSKIRNTILTHFLFILICLSAIIFKSFDTISVGFILTIGCTIFLVDVFWLIRVNKNITIDGDYILIQSDLWKWKEIYLPIEFIEKVSITGARDTILGLDRIVRISSIKNGIRTTKYFPCFGIPDDSKADSGLGFDSLALHLKEICKQNQILYVENGQKIYIPIKEEVSKDLKKE